MGDAEAGEVGGLMGTLEIPVKRREALLRSNLSRNSRKNGEVCPVFTGRADFVSKTSLFVCLKKPKRLYVLFIRTIISWFDAADKKQSIADSIGRYSDEMGFNRVSARLPLRLAVVTPSGDRGCGALSQTRWRGKIKFYGPRFFSK